MATYTYLNAHINGIRPYFFMYNGQRYNEAHFNGHMLFGQVKTPDPVTKYTPFFVENTTNADETLRIGKLEVDSPTLTIDYSTDGTTWQRLGRTNVVLTRTITPGEKIYLRCSTNSWTARSSGVICANRIRGISKVGGNIMSLIYGSSFTGNETSLIKQYTFTNIFYNNINLISADELILPATTIGSYDYGSMFCNCTLLTSVPVLPATTIGNFGYTSMFEGCTSLVTPPALPALNLSMDCYYGMFDGCTSLATAPELPALHVPTHAYAEMFYGCTSLITAPDLLATSYGDHAYMEMFYGCSSLNSIKCMVTNISGGLCDDWVDGVAATGTFTKKAGVTWPTGVSGIPNNWTIVEV